MNLNDIDIKEAVVFDAAFAGESLLMREQREILSDLQKIRDNKLSVCIFGCGLVGTGVGYDMLEFLNINVSCYCDNNPKLWGKEIGNKKIKCISLNELYQMKDIPCFIFIGHIHQEDVIHQLEKHLQGILITHFELESLDIIVDEFLRRCKSCTISMKKINRFVWTKKNLNIDKIKNDNCKKCAVYTCITGGYDDVTEPLYISEEYDYYIISDKEPTAKSIYKWIDIKDIVPQIVDDNALKNRFCKILGTYIFSEYKYSIYIDGNVQIKSELESSINQIGRSGIAVYLLPSNNCIYEHAIALCSCRQFNLDTIFWQMNEYHEAGMPRNYGIFECTILVRDNSNPVCCQVMLDWWNEVFNQIYRDQLSFTYCLWKNDVRFEDVGVLGEDHRKSNVFKMLTEHHTRIVDGKYEYVVENRKGGCSLGTYE